MGERCDAFAEIAASLHVTGTSDYRLQVEVANLAACERFHANALAGLPELGAVTSFVVMKTMVRPEGFEPPTF